GVGGHPGPGPEAGAGEADEPGEVALPERLGGGEVAGLEGAQPERDGPLVVHRHRRLLRWMARPNKSRCQRLYPPCLAPARVSHRGAAKFFPEWLRIAGAVGHG